MVKERLIVLDLMQGIAMFLVVIGHHLFDFSPLWYKHFHYYLYSFHMPLFIFISAFLIRYSYKDISNTKEYIKYVMKRVKKFTIPYFIIGIIITIISNIIVKEESFLSDIGYLIYAPKKGPAVFLWYIYLLLFLYAISPIIIKQSKYSKFLLLLLGLIGYWLPFNTQLFCLDYLSKYFLFYIIGIIIAENRSFLSRINKKYYIVCLILFVIFSVMDYHSNNKIVLFLFAILSIPSTYIVAKFIEKLYIINFCFGAISKNCFGVYLIHMFFVQGIALIYSHSNFYENINFLFYLLLSTIISIFFSISFTKMFYHIKNMIKVKYI